MNLIKAKEILAKCRANKMSVLNLNSYLDEDSLSDNDVEYLLPEIIDSSNIKTIDLSYNRIRNVFLFKELMSVNTLKMRHNEISDASFLKQLKQLKWLDLSYNHISDVSFLANLKSLRWIDLSHNQITDASFLINLNFLNFINLTSNSALSLPEKLSSRYKEFYRGDIDEIVRYYKQFNLGSDYMYEAKVLIVGEPMAGKTTLFKKLLNPSYNPLNATTEEKLSTIGIDVEVLEFPIDENKNFRAHLWDFGGNEKQYAIHQYFFTERSLYIVLASDRKESPNFSYWFEIIATMGVDCPVLVVLNEIESTIPNIDISIYRNEFGKKIQAIEEKRVNFAKDNDGRFESLVTEIKSKLRSLKHIGSKLPKTWIQISSKLLEIKNHTINIDEYFDICEKIGVDNLKDKLQILNYLHDLGVVLNYRNDDILRSQVILKPHWVIDSLYAVLKDESIIENLGRFSSNEVFDLWGEYKQNDKSILLELMQRGKFEVAYKLDTKNEYIAPILLPQIPPKYEFDETEKLEIHFQYKFMPKGIISRLIVRFHQHIVLQNTKQIVWKKGVLFKLENSLARIIESDLNSKITITVTGESIIKRRKLITIISNEIKRIHLDWFEDRLEYEELIPCICDICKDSNEPQLYRLEIVENYSEVNFEITCDKSVSAKNPKRIKATSLIGGVYDEKLTDNFKKIETYNRESYDLEHKSIQDFEKIQLNKIEKTFEKVLTKMDRNQKEQMELFTKDLIALIENTELFKLNRKEEKNLEEIKREKWTKQLKFVIPLIPKIPILGDIFPSANMELTKEVTSDEYLKRLQKGLYGRDLQLNVLETDIED